MWLNNRIIIKRRIIAFLNIVAVLKKICYKLRIKLKSYQKNLKIKKIIVIINIGLNRLFKFLKMKVIIIQQILKIHNLMYIFFY
jgi:hypothetical protein